MSFAFIVYFISVIGSIGHVFAIAAIAFTTWFVIGAICIELNNDIYETNTRHNFKPAFAAILFAVIAALIPSKNDAYLIAGAYAAEKVYDSEIGQDTLKLIHAKIKQQLEEMQQPKK